MVNLNTQLSERLPDHVALLQRAWCYGDALFESIRVFDGRTPLLPLHWARLERGLRLMGYAVPDHWSLGFWSKEILRVAPSNARVRLTVWRAPGGLYRPEDNTPQFLITAQALESNCYEWLSEGLQLGFCTSVRLPVDTFSGLKTLNAARYVAAAREAQQKGWGDGIILNAYNRVCEATSSNIFWFEGDALCTPPLSDGPVTGTLRELLFSLTFASKIKVVEKEGGVETLLAADEVFLCNAVRGIQWVRKCGGKVYSNAKTRMVFEGLVGHLFGSQKT